jgi:hypothetical protein
MTDPATAAERAVSDPEPQPQPDPSSSSSSSGSIDVLDRLVDGSRSGPSVDELCRDYNLDRGQALVLRGICRTGPGTGIPPIGDIVLGILLMITQWQDDGSSKPDEPIRAGDPNDVDPIIDE